MAVSQIFSDMLQSTIGDKVLYLSLVVALGALVLLAQKVVKKKDDHDRHINWVIRAFAGLLLFDYLLLAYYFVTSDFTYNYVWTFSDRNLSLYYKISAVLAGQQGTFLFWAMIIGLGSLWLNEKKESTSDFISKTQLIVIITGIVFILLTIKESPFKTIYQLYPDLQKTFIPDDGNGLNPLLIDPWMAVHPLVMFVGYAAVTNPFAISIVYLYESIKGRADEIEKIGVKNVLQFCRFAWFFLTFAIAIGGFWAYKVLGWGGFWAWDPVETASFIPWLMLTASMHTLVEHKKDRRKYAILSPVLVSLSFSLVVYATLVTRSGFFESVHAFGAGTTGQYLVIITLIATLAPLILGGIRYALVSDDEEDKDRTEDDYFLNKTNIFYITILFLVVLTYISIWGVTYPALLKLLANRKVGTGVAFFNLWSYPFFMGLFLLAGLCLSYRKSTRDKNLKELGLFTLLTIIAAAIRPGEAWNIVDYSAIVSAESPLLYRFIGGASALSFIPPMAYIIYSLTERYTLLIKPSKNRNFRLKEIGILCIHLGIVFITIGGVFTTMFEIEFSGSANINTKAISTVPNTPYGLQVVDYQTIIDYGDQDTSKEPEPLPGMSLREFYDSLSRNELSESPSIRGPIAEVEQTEHITYLLLKEGADELWVATERLEGNPIGLNIVAQGSLMGDFPSPTLNKTFDIILFASNIEEYSPDTGLKPYATTTEITFAVYDGGKKIGQGVAKSIKYKNGEANRVMIDRGITRDVYLIYNGLSGESASATVKLKPLINELWFGVALFMLGVALVFLFDPLIKTG